MMASLREGILSYHTQTPHRNTNTVVALAQAEIVVKLKLQVGARLTEKLKKLFEKWDEFLQTSLTL